MARASAAERQSHDFDVQPPSKSIPLIVTPDRGEEYIHKSEQSDLILHHPFQTLTHLGFNSIALFSFSGATFAALSHADSDLLPRSTSRYEFLTLFATAGVVSALASHLWFSRVIAGGLLKRGLTTREVRSAVLPSLGASGSWSFLPDFF
jgi:hypothetical protein